MDQLFIPKKVSICEVAPRDGFQAEHTWIPTDKKLEIIRLLARTGVQSIELTSFVHPKAIPQLKDAEIVTAHALQTEELQGIKFRSLVPNVKGAQRSIDAGIRKLKLMLSATDSHSISNANCGVEEAQNALEPIINLAVKHNVEVGGSISVIFGCPYEGLVPLRKIIPIMDRYRAMGIKEISLADTTGMGNPYQVYNYLGVLKEQYPEVTFSMHFHNTRGMAFANAVAALQQGVTNFDSSIAGLGGCPYAPGASGNIATEDLVHSFHEMGIETGIKLDDAILAAKKVNEMLGKKEKSSYMLQAGPNSQLSKRPDKQQKLESVN
ncbi:MULTISPECIES: hydroxymethylglutaryl-CoA lyase [Cytobacillus]|uniref:hydroxymethylglutaryl-CoA lyase n=1 Tax=Cytobacillus TaxID=2675230 RepID=UPI00203B771C|nr:hydroxymethylglutaryl-CoA lyase [Cytobacillus firmus]MCM3708449.1 hydroxymethylglutaryl-CoA lyase [Cytobacillus firmus]